MKRKIAFNHKLFLCFVFAFTFSLSFLGFRGMKELFAINSAYSGFDAGNIITDYVMSDYTSMSESDIQSFLKSKNSCNASVGYWRSSVGTLSTSYRETTSPTTWHVTNTSDSGTFICMADEKIGSETAAHIIYQAAQDYKINPKVLIVLLEKEQGLITDVIPNSFNYRSATGYGCPDNGSCDTNYYGLKNQVRNAARLFRLVLDNGSSYYPVGNNTIKYSPNSSCGSSVVNIQNRATSALYQYTPYQPNSAVLNSNPGTTVSCGAYGNANFYYYYTKWFGDTHTNVTTINFEANDVFTIQVGSGFYLVPESNKAGAKIVISGETTASNRQYKLIKSGDFYLIKHVASGLVLDIVDGETSNGANIKLSTQSSANSQKWRFSEYGTSYIIHSALADGKVFDIPSASIKSEGLAIQLYDDNKTAAQLFTIKDISDAPVSNGTYTLETLGDKGMDIKNGATSNGTRIHIWNLTQNKNQLYTLTRSADGFYTIKNVASSRVIDVSNASTENGAAIQLYTSNNSCAQKWIIEKSGSGYRFLSACSGKAIDVPGANIGSVNTNLQIYTANGTNAQVWVMKELQTIEDGEYILQSSVGSKSSNFVLDISGGAEVARDSTNIQIYSKNGTAAQTFKITYNSTAGAYEIYNTVAKRSIDVSSASTNSGANVQVWGSNHTCAQYWHIRQNSDKTYSIISACSDKVLDVSNASAQDGANVQIYEFNNTNAQKWTFSKVTTSSTN